jgi:UDP-glucose 4-epimerase
MVLITGGAGYIGSHLCCAMAESGLDFLIVDNFSNAEYEIIPKLENLIGRPVNFIDADISNCELMTKLMRENYISDVIHLAGFKSISESLKNPIDYYSNNLTGTISLLKAMQNVGIYTIVFSSSATVYGDNSTVLIDENCKTAPKNPYGWTKLMGEQVLADVANGQPSLWRIANLRYFNPVGSHSSGLLSDKPLGEPTNLFPLVMEVASGARPYLNIFGNDYPTLDGTGIRDYIHVMDLAEGHLEVLKYLKNKIGKVTINIGTGKGASVLQVLEAFERISEKKIPRKLSSRRIGDIAHSIANPALANRLLRWKANRNLDQMIIDAWNAHQMTIGKF